MKSANIGAAACVPVHIRIYRLLCPPRALWANLLTTGETELNKYSHSAPSITSLQGAGSVVSLETTQVREDK